MAGHDEVTIHIDKKEFKVSSPQTGEQLRELGNVGPDYDLWEEVPGGQDKLIEPTDSVKLKNGMHFFSVQKSINPGR
jgi:Multiubiquitin